MPALIMNMADIMRLAIALALFAGCAPAQTTRAASSHDDASIVDQLRASGLQLEGAGAIDQTFLSVPADVYRVGDGELQIYRYATPEGAARDAAKIDPSGSGIGTHLVTWIAPPHFFRRGSTTVNYLGSDERVLNALRHLMGPQFAGQ